MLGWYISAYEQAHGGDAPATFTTHEGGCIAQWDTGLQGLDWIDKIDDSVSLGGNGYPLRYSIRLQCLRVYLYETVPPTVGKPVHIDHDLMAAIPDDQWIIIEAWDAS